MGKRGVKYDLTGQRFGRLVVVKFIETVNRVSWWRCKCDCGNEHSTTTSRLRSGQTKSCGCYAAEYRGNKPRAVEKARQANTKHGGTHERLFRIWTSMRSRCSDKSAPAYKWYGAKGIKVCEEWSEYPKFREWSYENGYDDKAKKHNCSIDRIDPNGDYCPENCRWADAETQGENKTNVVLYEYNGEKHSLTAWARKYGIHPDTMRWRVKRLGWSLEKAITYKPWECNRKENAGHEP